MNYTSRSVYEHISIQQNDPILERRRCAVSWAEFPLYQSDHDFYEKISPVFDGRRCIIPYPTLCPEERQRRRQLFRNDRKLYRRRCDLTWVSIVSLYHPDYPYTVYSQEARRSDDRSAFDYAMPIDRTKTFTEQYKILLTNVPKISNLVKTSENCTYNIIMWNSKDCYMCSTTFQSNTCTHCYRSVQSENCIDCTNIFSCSQSYECVDCSACTWLLHSQMCSNCSMSSFLFDCEWCDHCTLCTWLRNKSYCYMNQQLTKEEYLEKIADKDYEDVAVIFEKLKKEQVRKATIQTWSTWSIGNNLFDCKECTLSYNLTDCTRTKYSYDSVVWVKDCYDVSMIGDQVERMYEAHACGYTWYQTAFSNLCWTNDSLYYCDYCMYSSHCFWSVWLRNASYCIFNTQYTKEQYEQLVPKLITHMTTTWEWGEFFHPSLSPFAYNETRAHQHMPLTKEQAKSRWYARQDSTYQIDLPENAVTTTAQELNSSTTLYDPSHTKKILICSVSWKPYRLVPQELSFYEKHRLQIPSFHPDIRHQSRLDQRLGTTLYLRPSDDSWEEMLSVYDEVYTEKVVSEEEYLSLR